MDVAVLNLVLKKFNLVLPAAEAVVDSVCE
jgi:hypothetical protein